MEIEELYTKSRETGRQESIDSNVPCDLCIENTKDITKAFRIIADYLCFKCKLYLCAKCYIEGHAKHTSVCATSETKEREKKVEHFVDKLLKQTRKFRRKKIKKRKYKPAVVDCVNLKHQHDQNDCDISGLCGLNSGKLVFSDSVNRSIKVVKLGSNVIERDIRLSYRPFGVTEIGVNQTHTDLDSATSMAYSETEGTEMGTKTLLAVTVPCMRSIVCINLNETPATRVRRIFTDGPCYGIEFCDGRIYTTVGRSTSRNFVRILSIDGTVLKSVECMPNWNANAYGYLAAVSPDEICITGDSRGTVICMDSEGVITSRITMHGFYNICLTGGNDKNIYVCSLNMHNVYRMDTDLKQYRPVLDGKYSLYMKDPYTLSCYRDKLYVSHYPWTDSDIRNFITVARLYK